MWTDETREQAVQLYVAKNPTAENSMELVNEVAEELGESPNGVRMILTKAEVYIKKQKAENTTKEAKTPRVSKEAAQAALSALIEEDFGLNVDTDIISKMTGKAATYFTGLLTAIKAG